MRNENENKQSIIFNSNTIEQWEELIENINILKNIKNLQQYELEEVDNLNNRYKLLKQDFA